MAVQDLVQWFHNSVLLLSTNGAADVSRGLVPPPHQKYAFSLYTHQPQFSVYSTNQALYILCLDGRRTVGPHYIQTGGSRS